MPKPVRVLLLVLLVLAACSCSIGGEYGWGRGRAALIIVDNEAPGQRGYLLNREGVQLYRNMLSANADSLTIVREFEATIRRSIGRDTLPIRQLEGGRYDVADGTYFVVVFCENRLSEGREITAHSTMPKRILLTRQCLALDGS
jgi:hypothetical protein